MPSALRARPTVRNRGFSLLEVLVAFAIMASTLGVLYQVFSTGLRTVAAAEEYGEATRHAQSLLTEHATFRPLEVGEQRGEYANTRYAWHVSVKPLDLDALGLENSQYVQALQISVQVDWPSGRGDRSVELSTMRLQPSQ